MRAIADLLRSHPRNDHEALGLIVAGFFLVWWFDPLAAWPLYAGYLVLCGFVFQRWFARIQSIQAWPPESESAAEWPPKSPPKN